MRALVVRAACAAAIWPAIAGAQTLSLTEAEAVARFSVQSPRVEAVRAAVDVLRADATAAGRWPNPTVMFNRESVAAATEHMVLVAQRLPVTGRRRLEMEAAEARVGAGASRADEQVRRLRADLRLAFIDLWLAQTRERELARSRGRVEELAAVLARREMTGDSAGFDRLRSEREVIDLDADRSNAAVERARAQGALASYFAAAPDVPIVEAVIDRRPPVSPPAVDELVARATARGAFMALERDREAAVLAERAAARRVVPEPEIVAGTKSSNLAGGDVGSVVSVHVTVPLFDRFASERAAARARAAQARAESDALQASVRAQVAAWRTAVIERRETAVRYRAAVAAGAEIERIAQVSYDAGERGILELLDAYRTATAARLRQEALDAGVREAEIELEFVSGWEAR